MSYQVKRTPLNSWERIYLPEIFRGFAITAGHFFRNIFFHILHLFGLSKKTRAAVTYQYPEERKLLSYRSRTRHRLTRRANGAPRCVACMLCATVCPARCIAIQAEEDPDPNIEKRPRCFEIDLGRCVYCGFCVEVCPVDAIRKDTQIVDTAAYSRKAMILDKEMLLDPSRS